MTTILTSNPYPPIPIRYFDWSACTDNYDGAPDAPYQLTGSGPTKFLAVLDLYNSWDDHNYPTPLIAHRPGFMEDLTS